MKGTSIRAWKARAGVHSGRHRPGVLRVEAGGRARRGHRHHEEGLPDRAQRADRHGSAVQRVLQQFVHARRVGDAGVHLQLEGRDLHGGRASRIRLVPGRPGRLSGRKRRLQEGRRSGAGGGAQWRQGPLPRARLSATKVESHRDRARECHVRGSDAATLPQRQEASGVHSCQRRTHDRIPSTPSSRRWTSR